jgi:preprotein translocase subunit SecY
MTTASAIAPTFPTHDFGRRLAVTLAALVVYRIASHIPLPGLDFTILNTLNGGAIERLSIMALGFLPWVAAVTLAELASLVLPPRYTAAFCRHGHANPFSPWVIVAALIFTVLQGYGVSVALEAMKDTVVTPGLAFTATAIGSYVGCTALAILLAYLISQYGIGFGFWVLLAAAVLTDVRMFFTTLYSGVAEGFLSPAITLLSVGVLVAAALAVVVLVLARRDQGRDRLEPLVWPIFIYAAVSPYLAVLAANTIGYATNPDQVVRSLLPDHVPGAILALLLIALICYRYAMREGNRSLLATDVLLLAALVCLTVGAPAWIGIWFPNAGPFVVLITVMTLIAQRVAARMEGKP